MGKVNAICQAHTNNLMKYPLSYVEVRVNRQIAKFEHIQTFRFDQSRPISMIPKITARHFNLSNHDKMKVSLATQLLSNSMSSAIKTMFEDSTIKNLGKEPTPNN